MGVVQRVGYTGVAGLEVKVADDQAAGGLVAKQCDCTFVPNAARLDFPEYLALIAPRPLLILGGRKDPLFPPAGFRAACRRIAPIYDLFAASPAPGRRLRLVESDQGHDDPPAFLRETRRWMCRWLQGREAPRAELDAPSPAPERPDVLRCTRAIPDWSVVAVVLSSCESVGATKFTFISFNGLL